MTAPHKTRRYDARGRRASAEATRDGVLRAALDLFATKGFAGTSVAEVATSAGVSVDTVYATVGRKPTLLLAVVDLVLAEGAPRTAADQREYVREVRAARDGAGRIRAYAAGLGRVMPRAAPLILALREAGLSDGDCRAMAEHLAERRAANMLRFAADLRETGDLRDDLTDQEVADLVWATNSPEFFRLLETRGYRGEAYVQRLADLWCRTLLADRDQAR